MYHKNYLIYINLLVAQEDFNSGNKLLSRICELTDSLLVKSQKYREAISNLFITIEQAEQNFFNQ